MPQAEFGLLHHRIVESPRSQRFESHVAFDNVPLGDATEYNPIAFTLNHRHAGFQFRRRHRTFMVGVDDNSYSDHALQWLLDELVDDGDEIVCVRVIETQVRLTNKQYQEDAKTLMASIQAKNIQNRAISLVLEFAVGKLHNTFQHLIKIYQPSMLVVGTKGRSLDGVQGFLVNRSSFSKYCLQYSPVPVVVVRPNEKREKKKAKRAHDPSRQSYVHMLLGQKHEADSENSSVYELEPNLTPDEEAHRVAVAVGLPAAYDPTIKPIDPATFLKSYKHRQPAEVAEVSKETLAIVKKGGLPAEKKSPDREESDSDSEGEFEATPGDELIRRQRLHNMEVNEGAALRAEGRKLSSGSADSDEDPPGGGAKT
ncbi:universal stress protein family [Hypoxylon rubiginosum]|uniref:Universal stress protein family n=1 Tax=Hypoxylon rubiginosum TaxID=110542 RepID=A0ACC0D4E9_9PEZI|nr:universal stress protein family [Hypoxylon rubiginosum]